MTRRLEELELKRIHEVQVAKAPVQVKLCPNCHHMNIWWRNALQLQLKGNQLKYQQPDPPSQQSSSIEQAITNLSKVVGDFVGKQEATNARVDQRIDRMENMLNKRMDGMQNDMNQNLITSKIQSRAYKFEYTARKGRFPSQPHQNPKGKPIPEPHVEKEEEIKKGKEMEDKESEISEEKKDSDSTMKAIPEKELQGRHVKKSTSPPFPQALHGKKGIRNAAEILEVLRQVKVNIPLLDMIKQVPTHDWRKGSGESLARFGSKCEFASIYRLQAIGPWRVEANSNHFISADRSRKFQEGNGLMQLTFGNMTLDLNIFYMSKKQITPEEEEGPEELCIIDTLVEEHYNQNMQDKLNESLVDVEEVFSESPIGLATLQSWRKIEEILPLFNKEEEAAVEKEIPKLNLKPLPVELKYTYLEENNQCPVVISSSLTSHQENCLMEVLKRCKKAIG
ncbi:hypothetical protein AAG906_021232 [Vitis piasezkii]